jgi:hypothetical protein
MPDFENEPNLTEGIAVEVPQPVITYDYLNISQDLSIRLGAINDNRIAAAILKLTCSFGASIPKIPTNLNYLGISIDDPTKLSYMTYDRVSRAYDSGQGHRIWEDKDYRYHSGAGKVVKKLLSSIPHLTCLQGFVREELEFKGMSLEEVSITNLAELFTETDFDQFNNRFRIEGFRQGDSGEVIFVKGHWIAELYHEKNYASISGNLGNSCMRYDRTNGYLDIYTKNLNICKMAVLLNQEGKVQGRAIVWTVGTTDYYDRIYATSDLIQDRMKAFFLVQGIKTCYPGYFPHEEVVIKQDTTNLDINKRVLLNHRHYPYMDSLKFLTSEYDILSNEVSNMDSSSEYLLLNDTAGSYEEVGSDNSAECHACGREMDEDDTCYVDLRIDDNYNENICSRCSVYSDHHSTYITRDNATYIESINDWVLTSEVIRDWDNNYILAEDAVELVDGSYAHHDDEDMYEYASGGYFLLSNTNFEAIEWNDSYYKPEECLQATNGNYYPIKVTQEHEGEIWYKPDLDAYLNLNLI